MNKFINIVFIGSCMYAVISTVLALLFGIIAVWMDFTEELICDVALTWYLSLIIFFIAGAISGWLKYNL